MMWVSSGGLVCKWPPCHCVLTWQKALWCLSSGHSSYRIRAPPSWPHWTLITSLLQTVTLGWGLQHRNSVGAGGTQFSPYTACVISMFCSLRPASALVIILVSRIPVQLHSRDDCKFLLPWGQDFIPWLLVIPLCWWNLRPLDQKLRESFSGPAGHTENSARMAAPWGPGLLSVPFVEESSHLEQCLAHHRLSGNICAMNDSRIAAVQHFTNTCSLFHLWGGQRLRL